MSTVSSAKSLSRRAFLQVAGVASGALALAACVAPAAPGAPAAGGDAGAAAPSAATVAITYTNYSSGADKELWDGIIANFEEKTPGIEVTYLPIPGDSWGEYFDKVATMIAGGNAPDVLRVAIEGILLFVSRGLALPIDDMAEGDAEIAEYKTDVSEKLLEPFVVDGKTYGYPFDWNNMVMFYNTTMFAEAGLEPPKEDWTLEQWLETAQTLTKRTEGSEDAEVFGFGTAIQYFAGMMPWIFNFGGNLLNDEWTESQVNSPEVIDAITFMRDLIWDYRVAPQAPSSHGDILNLASSGRLAMWGGGRWPTLALTQAGFFDFDVQLWPAHRDQVTEYGVGAFPILESTEHVEEAFTWIKYLTSVEAFTVITELGQSIPAAPLAGEK